VETTFAVDADYRDRAARGTLRHTAPRRFNPQRDAWLPILSTERDGWDFTVLFSNTARAHELGAPMTGWWSSTSAMATPARARS
jgi:hypothetical protein